MQWNLIELEEVMSFIRSVCRYLCLSPPFSLHTFRRWQRSNFFNCFWCFCTALGLNWWVIIFCRCVCRFYVGIWASGQNFYHRFICVGPHAIPYRVDWLVQSWTSNRPTSKTPAKSFPGAHQNSACPRVLNWERS